MKTNFDIVKIILDKGVEDIGLIADINNVFYNLKVQSSLDKAREYPYLFQLRAILKESIKKEG